MGFKDGKEGLLTNFSTDPATSRQKRGNFHVFVPKANVERAVEPIYLYYLSFFLSLFSFISAK